MSSHAVFFVTLHACRTFLYNSHSSTYCRDPMLSSDFASVKSPVKKKNNRVLLLEEQRQQIVGHYCSHIQTSCTVMLNTGCAFLCPYYTTLCLSFDICVSSLHMQTPMFHYTAIYLWYDVVNTGMLRPPETPYLHT
jgi:hypothetical protein